MLRFEKELRFSVSAMKKKRTLTFSREFAANLAAQAIWQDCSRSELVVRAIKADCIEKAVSQKLPRQRERGGDWVKAQLLIDSNCDEQLEEAATTANCSLSVLIEKTVESYLSDISGGLVA